MTPIFTQTAHWVMDQMAGTFSRVLSRAELLYAARLGRPLATDSRVPLVEAALRAVADDNVAEVDRLLEMGISPNAQGRRGETLLTEAVEQGSLRVARRLLSTGDIEVEARNAKGLTALAVAAHRGDDLMVVELIAHGADVHAANGMGQTPVMLAALMGNTTTVEILITAGANLTAADRLGNTPLSLARGQSHTGLAKVLRRARGVRPQQGVRSAEGSPASAAFGHSSSVRLAT